MKIISATEFHRTSSKASGEVSEKIIETTQEIISNVIKKGDKALREYTKKFDRHHLSSLEVSAEEIKEAHREVSVQEFESLRLAAKRIESFHRIQAKKIQSSWRIQQEGTLLGEEVRPLSRVGIYVPGGRASYPSTVLMNAIPARVAGVREIIMVSPWSGGKASAHTLVAAELAGVHRIFKIGGAQAIAALAYGTETVPAVDKIVGPGNIFVATAKRLVFGRVGLDMIAGPTEIVVLADQSARADYIASDLISQAEHDPLAVSILVTTSMKLAKAVQNQVVKQLHKRDRQEILKKSLQGQGAIIVTKNLSEAIVLTNRIAPEHLSLQVTQPKQLIPQISHAGAIFIGPYSPVACGDYLAGPNHVLPTAGTARFSSPLGVSDFLKRSSVIEFTQKALERLAPDVIRLARMEGLTAHAASVEIRKKEIL